MEKRKFKTDMSAGAYLIIFLIYILYLFIGAGKGFEIVDNNNNNNSENVYRKFNQGHCLQKWFSKTWRQAQKIKSAKMRKLRSRRPSRTLSIRRFTFLGLTSNFAKESGNSIRRRMSNMLTCARIMVSI